MSDAVPSGSPEPEAPKPSRARAAARVSGRFAGRTAKIVAALIGALIVFLAIVDLGRIRIKGQDLRSVIETQGSKFLERPLHVGKVTAYLSSGRFVFEDLRIDGRTPSDRPFFTAKQIVITAAWWKLAVKQMIVNVTINDWQMVVEKWPNGVNNVPHLRPRGSSSKPAWFKTIVEFVNADRGTFIYDDHTTPWSVVAPNLNVDIARHAGSYVGTAKFRQGVVQIQNFLPMATDFATRFTIDGPMVHLHNLDLVSDGSVSRITGEVDFANWPRQIYHVDSKLSFPRMREIFFQDASWRVTGDGRYLGTFQVRKDGRFELKGDFSSPETRLIGLQFPNLTGALIWEPGRFAVTHAESDLYAGRMNLAYSLEGIGTPRGSTATFNASYAEVDLASYGRAAEWWQSIQPTGRGTGHVAMTWLNGHFSTTLAGAGETTVAPATGVALAQPQLPATPVVVAPEPQPFDPYRPLGPFPVGGHIAYKFNGDTLTLEDSWAASPTTYIGFHGSTDFRGKDPNIPIHVVSLDWQNSDRILAGVLNAFGSKSSAIEVGGQGTFDGALTQSLSHPLITGKFDGRHIRAWNVTWGRAVGDITVHSDSSYLDIANGVIGDRADQQILADGRFSLGYRKDNQDEMNARVRAKSWPLSDLKTAFGWNDWPIDGLGTADLNLHGPYRTLLGGGAMQIDQAVAWGERFSSATAQLSFEPDGVYVKQIEMAKGPTGKVEASAALLWNHQYSFEADGKKIPVESLDEFQYPRAPLTGVLNFHASGVGDLDHVTYSFRGNIERLFVADEEIGDVTGHFVYRDRELTIDQLEATSFRLQVSLAGVGRLSLNELNDVDITLLYRDTSIDPYLKFLAPAMSPYTRARVTGSVRMFGALADISAMNVDAKVDDAKLQFFDYDLHNPADKPIRLTLENNVINVGQLTLAGQDTNLELTGIEPGKPGLLSLGSAPTAMALKGQASLAILQAFGTLRDLRASGLATIEARLEGDFNHPLFSGDAEIQSGMIRHTALPHSIEKLNGVITFDAGGINVDGLRGQMGEGDVTFGGSISLRQYKPEEFNLTATGKSMHVRFPEGFQSTVDANMALTGPVAGPTGPTLSGTVNVLNAQYLNVLDPANMLASITALSTLGTPAPTVSVTTPTGYPMHYDIQVNVPPVTFINSKDAKVTGHGEFSITGTLDRPNVTGRVDVDSGEFFFQGNRYVIGPTSSIDFSNPVKFTPFFDVDLTTHPHGAGQTYEVGIHLNGTFDRFNWTINSDPWLPDADIITLLFGEAPSQGKAETRAFSPQQSQEVMMRTVLSQIVLAPFSSRVGSVFQRVLPLDTVQISPALGTAANLQNPNARLTVVQRISSRAFLTYSRAFNTADQIILLEYDQSDRVSWVLSRNEDRSFALEFRIRHVY